MRKIITCRCIIYISVWKCSVSVTNIIWKTKLEIMFQKYLDMHACFGTKFSVTLKIISCICWTIACRNMWLYEEFLLFVTPELTQIEDRGHQHVGQVIRQRLFMILKSGRWEAHSIATTWFYVNPAVVHREVRIETMSCRNFKL